MKPNVVFVQSANINEFDINAILCSPLIPSQLIDESAKFNNKRQVQFLTCRYLLAKLLNHYFDIPTLPTIIIGDNNRPRFQQWNFPDFNISHSGDFIAVAICSHGNIGVDIEQKRSRKNYLTIAEQFFSMQENSWLHQQDDQLAAFWRLWTLRESALKLYSKGVWQMKEMQIDMPQQQISATFATAFYSQHQVLDQIYLSVSCSEKIHEWKII